MQKNWQGIAGDSMAGDDPSTASDRNPVLSVFFWGMHLVKNDLQLSRFVG